MIDVNQQSKTSAYYRRKKPRIIRFVRYKLQTDPENYYREKCLLFLPWKNEREEIENENVNSEELFKANIDIIASNEEKYCVLSDDSIQLIVDQMNEGNKKENDVDGNGKNQEDDEENRILRHFIGDDNVEQEQLVDLFDQIGTTKSKDKESIENRYFSPQKFPKEQILSMLEPLNELQRSFLMHVYKSIVTNRNIPLRIFLSGSAGVGKSTLINAIYQLISHHFDNLSGQPVTTTIKVLLTAFAGKAAFLINGSTLHTAFALPVNQSTNMPELSSDIANTIRIQLRDLKLLVIDEISMVGSRLLNRVSTRLIQIMGKNEPFGGVSVILVGDLNQLPPVFDSPVYEAFDDSGLSILANQVLFDEFKYFELTQIMRQKDETESKLKH